MKKEDYEVLCSQIYDDYLNSYSALNNTDNKWKKILFERNVENYQSIIKDVLKEFSILHSKEEAESIRKKITGEELYEKIKQFISIEDCIFLNYTKRELRSHFDIEKSIFPKKQKRNFYIRSLCNELRSIEAIVEFAQSHAIDPLAYLNKAYILLDLGDEDYKRSVFDELIDSLSDKSQHEILYDSLEQWKKDLNQV